MQKAREEQDYDLDAVPLSEEDVKQIIEDVEHFVRRVEQFLREEGAIK